MAQLHKTFNTGLMTITANNIGIYVGNNEVIIINDLNVVGITNFSLMIKNYSTFGTIQNVKVYGSHNGMDFYLIQDDVYPNNILPTHIEYSNFYGLTSVMRITATADIDGTNMDIYLQGSTI